MAASTLHVLRVFTAADGAWGNRLGVFLDGAEVPPERRQVVAADLGYSETVFVDNRERGECRIFTPGEELPFAGHPSVGAAWLLEREGQGGEVLRPPAGEIAIRREGELTFVAARAEWCPPWELMQLGSVAEVEGLSGPPAGRGFAYCWAWVDEGEGVVRARSFPLDVGIAEDEATGSAAIPLSLSLARPLTVHQGQGSLLHGVPLDEGRAEVGGRTVLDEVRDYQL